MMLYLFTSFGSFLISGIGGGLICACNSALIQVGFKFFVIVYVWSWGDLGGVTRGDFAKCRTHILRLFKKQTVGVVYEVIIFSVYILFLFTHYYFPSPSSWDVVANSMSSFWRDP